MTYRIPTNQEYSELELAAALDFWSRFHSTGSRRRVRAAIRFYRDNH